MVVVVPWGMRKGERRQKEGKKERARQWSNGWLGVVVVVAVAAAAVAVAVAVVAVAVVVVVIHTFAAGKYICSRQIQIGLTKNIFHSQGQDVKAREFHEHQGHFQNLRSQVMKCSIWSCAPRTC